MRPLISSIIPAFNAARYLAEAVESLQRQAVHDIEILIIDDGSNDETLSLARRLACGDPRVRVLSQPNAGVSAARNAGLRVASGHWIHFLDADDFMLDGGLDAMLNNADQGGHDAVCADAMCTDESGRSLDWFIGPGLPPGQCFVSLDDLIERNRFQPAATLIRRDSLGGRIFSPEFSAGEDWDLWLRLAEHGLTWRAIEQPVSAYRLRPASLSRHHARMASQSRQILHRAFERLSRSVEARMPEPPDLSRDRFTSLVTRLALHQAAGAVLASCPTRGESSLDILLHHADRAHCTCALLAESAWWMLPIADGCVPSAWRTDGEHFPRLAHAARAFWRTCAEAGLISIDNLDECTQGLAAHIVDPRAVADTVVASLDSDLPVTLLGLGTNARHLAAALRANRIDADGFDDRFAGSTAVIELAGGTIEAFGDPARLDPARQFIMTVTDDQRFIATLPRSLRIVRWADALRALQRRHVARLDAILRQSPKPAREAA